MKNLRILFLIERAKTNIKGLVPLRCRITYLGQRKLFSTGIFMNAECWFSKLQKAKPFTDENDFINYEITLITNRLNKAFLVLQAQEEEFTVGDVYAQYSGKSKASNEGIIKYYSSFIEKLKKLVDIEIKQVTWNKYNYTYSDLKSFIEERYNKKDIYLKNLDMANRLQAGSPVINKGNNNYFNPEQVPDLHLIITDLDGNPRFVCSTIDMGAYEAQGECLIT